ncbi:Cation-independent mannose-6-phosphate receptor CI-MPR [Sporothrix epigloea]|uniref:Autophagy-related protein 27 n=1 Tax=Sporothrix epigloea TaxID=1892477 RepID=A0ABP0DCN0_9PEZI
MAAPAAIPSPASESSAAAPSKTTTTMPCTATSTSGAFYDLRHDIVLPPVEGAKKPKAGIQVTDYTARGHDYGANFTLNICAAVVKPIINVEGVDRDLWANVSAYYEQNGDTFSLGQESSVLVSRGRELVLQYTGGSPCPDLSNDKGTDGIDRRSEQTDEPIFSTQASKIRRKSATFAFLCDRDPLETTAHISFVGTPDECAYFFKVRSPHACAGAEPHKPGSVGPGGVFAIILGVALLVYMIGGVVYNRTVAQARGWRQLPNHTLWLGIWSFVRVRILCGRRFGSSSSSVGGDGVGSGPDNGFIGGAYDEVDGVMPHGPGHDRFWGTANKPSPHQSFPHHERHD